jgi:hypothetical protein
MIDFVGKPNLPENMQPGPVLFWAEPLSVSIEDRLMRIVNAINMHHAWLGDINRVLCFLSSALALQPAIDRQQLFSDFMVQAEAMLQTPHPDAQSSLTKTIAWYIQNPTPAANSGREHGGDPRV